MSVTVQTETIYGHFPTYFLLKEYEQMYDTENNIQSECDENQCGKPYDGCWCNLIETLKTKHDGVAKFIIRNTNLIGVIRKSYTMRVIAERPNLDQDEVKLKIDFLLGGSVLSRTQYIPPKKIIKLEFDLDGKPTTLESETELKDAEWTFQCRKLPDELRVSDPYTYRTRSPMNCELVKSQIINYIRCPKDQVCWCLLTDQIRSLGCGGIRIPLCYSTGTSESSYHLDIMAQRDDEDDRLLHINTSVHWEYVGYPYRSKKPYPERYILE